MQFKDVIIAAQPQRMGSKGVKKTREQIPFLDV